MSRLTFAIPLALLVPLAAAAAPASRPFASLDEFARAIGMKKGGWQTRAKVTSARIGPSPTADPAALEEVRAGIEKRTGLVKVKDECSGPSIEGGPRLPGIILEPGCSLSGLRAANGRWSLSCALSRNGETGKLESEGTYSRKSVTARHEGDFTYKGVVIHLTAETESRWVGKCRAPRPYVPSATSD